MSKPSLTFTFDLEDHRPDESVPKRYDVITHQLLDFLDERNIKATIFTVGQLAEKDPALVRAAHKSGHEIAHHSYDHTVLTKQTPDEFREHTMRGKNILEDVIGVSVKGFRAPVFSLTRETLWAVDILKELGFEYSSSILPAANPLHGFAGAPETPFRWSNGLIEIPSPVGQVGTMVMPYLGGIYFRYLPFCLIEKQMQKAANDSVLWTYCHPYDFDGSEKNWRIKGASTPVSFLLWLNRKNTFKKMERLMNVCNVLPPFSQQSFSDDLPIIDPATL